MTVTEAIHVDQERFAHTSIRASAGSGKTFQLTHRYLQLIEAGAEPAGILASTFTRLAAGEIRDRVLMSLVKSGEDPKERRELSGRLGIADLSRPRVIDLLTALVRRLHQVQIRTLDSFFAQIVRSFAIELGIPLGAEVVDETQARQMRAEAIRLMLDERKPQELVDLLRLLTQGSSERGVMQTIDRVVCDLYGLHQEAGDQAWEYVPDIPGRLPPKKLVEAIQRLEEVACDGDARHRKAYLEDCNQARQWDWERFIGSGLAKAIASGSNLYRQTPIDPTVIAAYQPLVNHARAELVGRVRDQTIATRELLRLFDVQYQRVKHRRRAITFDDLTAAIVKAHQLGKLDEIGFRLDARLRHLLLDEFQDTSVPQWRALEPLVRELISYAPPERTFFCVGDVKQSIYGWRDAAPEILDELPHLLAGPDGSSAIRQADLARSYRSSQPIIDVVNKVFGSLEDNESLMDFADAVQAWQNGFVHHETTRHELSGYVELRTSGKANDKPDQNELRYNQAAKLAADLHKQNEHLSIAILTRTNPAVARLLYELGPSRLQIPAGGRGGGPLTDAAPVNALLDLLHLADHPDDTVAAFHVDSSPLGKAIGLTDHSDADNRHCVACEVRRSLLIDGYGQTLAAWVRPIASSCDARELRRLQQLVELAASFESRSTLRTADFIDLVEHTTVADVQPSPVQVMTIHQSKGLQFDVVILPELECLLTGASKPPVVFDRKDEIGPITRICRYMNRDVRAFVPELEPMFARHKRRAVRESLSLLYVAMTRAIHGLYMIIDPPSQTERSMPKRLSGVLRAALAAGDNEPGRILFDQGDLQWIAEMDSTARSN